MVSEAVFPRAHATATAALRRHQVVSVLTVSGDVSLVSSTSTGELKSISKLRPVLVVGVQVETSLEGIVETHRIGLLLVFGIAELTVKLLLVALLHKEDQVWVVRLLDDARKVHGVVHLVLRLKHFLKTKVVMALL